MLLLLIVDLLYDGLLTVMGLFSFLGIFFKCARVGERLSPYVSLACVAMAVTIMMGS